MEKQKGYKPRRVELNEFERAHLADLNAIFKQAVELFAIAHGLKGRPIQLHDYAALLVMDDLEEIEVETLPES